MPTNQARKYRNFFAFLLLAYTAFLFVILVFKALPALHLGHLTLQFGGTQSGSGNWIPFKTILPYLLGEKGLLIGGINIAGNIVLLIPIGYLMPFVFNSLGRLKTTAISIGFCFLIESIQSICKIGIFDIDDVILNALGIFIGLWFATWKPRLQLYGLLLACLFSGIIGFSFIKSLENKPFSPPNIKLQGKTEQALNDLCGGTGGIGKIIKIDKEFFAIKLKNGTTTKVFLSKDAKIQSSNGMISYQNLPIGKAVTLIGGPTPNGDFIADLVLICLDNQNVKTIQ